jgi:hypothetical protein
LYSSPSIVRLVKLRRKRWAGNDGTYGSSKKCMQIFCSENNGRDHLEDVSIDGRTILKGILKKTIIRMWPEFIWLRTGTNIELL